MVLRRLLKLIVIRWRVNGTLYLTIGAMLSTEELSHAFGPGSHATTFGGNPVACAAALASIEVIESEGLLEHAAALGEFVEPLAGLEHLPARTVADL